MFKTSFEVPISLLEKSKEFNDYDYALFHLINKYPSYKKFYKKSNREIILDNSAYEFYIKNEIINVEEFTECVREIEPTYFILPDKLNDFKTTLFYLEKSFNIFKNIKSKKIGVVQGGNLKEFVDCYNLMKKEVDKIGISFGYSFLPSLVPDIFRSSLNKFQIYAMGRINLLVFLKMEGVIDESIPHHLLGTYLPFEFSYYKSPFFNFINTIDTSYPVKNGFNLKKIKMDGTDLKEEILIDDFINKKLTFSQEQCILYNINKFKGLI